MSSVNLNYLPALPRNRTPGIGCIGAGFIMDDCHLVAYRQAGFNPVAISSREPEKSRAVAQRHNIKNFYSDYRDVIANPQVSILDIAVPPDVQVDIVREAVKHKHIKGILVQKPMGVNFDEALTVVKLCADAGITLAVNQNMRYDQSIRACKSAIEQHLLGNPVFATIDMRAIPHFMDWQKKMGWATLRIMSIHHLDSFRYLFGEPLCVYASVTQDPRIKKDFDHEDGVCVYILEYANGLRAVAWDDIWTGPAREGAIASHYINWRVEGTAGMAKGSIGWPAYPERKPSTIDITSTLYPGEWISPRWNEVWFPDAFAGPMAQLLCAIENGSEPEISGADNLKTMALVDACYLSFKQHRPVFIEEIYCGGS
ncbi:gfo/Idh/MocA family oxidoreductase [Mucilaginibacter hurinus]|uniref:Gfo/Idh/MocA family oxidoreductase n=1 Tax=Mucilaginibacter hurinus TaxID=2201324 RepID=A0A367GT74_9SPHI|nr:Gfo/Idh/MocA family oxidoreductase [Mucilaginibacter hurinus]RCH56589.1 gfo/Idh/MocA family oxidoreductase [Mucilaginibacter hurinus]